MKKLKLFLSVSSLCLCLAVLCFGVFSATSVSYNIGGSISYEVNDAFVKINTKVYKNSNQYNQGDLEILAEELADGTTTVAKESFILDTTINIGEYDSTSQNSFLFDQLNLNFSSKDKCFLIETEITNLSPSMNVWVLADLENISMPENVVQGNNVIIREVTSTSPKKMYFAMSIKDMKSSVVTSNFNLQLRAGIGDYSLTNENLSKVNLTWTDSSWVASPNGNNATGLFVFPESYTSEGHTGAVTVAEGTVDADNPLNSSSTFTSSQFTTIVLPESMTQPPIVGLGMVPTLTRVILPSNYVMDVAFLAGTGIHSARVRALTQYSYAYCTNLESVKFYDTVTKIEVGTNSFAYCSNLKYLFIPKTLEVYNVESNSKDDIAEGEDETILICALNNNAMSLEKIEVDPEHKNCSTIDGVLFNKDKSILISYPTGRKDKFYVLPTTVRNFAMLAFAGADNLEGVDLGNYITCLDNLAFCSTGLKQIIIPDQVTRLDDNVFADCPNLEKVIIGKSVSYIGVEAFGYNPKLSYVEINSDIETITIRNHAFACSNPGEGVRGVVISSFSRIAKNAGTTVYSLNKGQNIIEHMDTLSSYGGSTSENSGIYLLTKA